MWIFLKKQNYLAPFRLLYRKLGPRNFSVPYKILLLLQEYIQIHLTHYPYSEKKRSNDSAGSCADVVHVAQRTRRTPAEFCMRVAPKDRLRPKSNKICSGVRAFSREFLHDFERRNRAISIPDNALVFPVAATTSCILRDARGARRPSFANLHASLDWCTEIE